MWSGSIARSKLTPTRLGTGHEGEEENAGPGVHSLPEGLWPVADRAAWQEARRPSVRLQRGGAASHLRPVVQHDPALLKRSLTRTQN